MYKLNFLALTFLVSGCGAAPRMQEIASEEPLEEMVEAPMEGAKTKGKTANLFELENEAQLNDLIASGKLIFVDFFATWCGPCKKFSELLHQVVVEFPDIVFVKVDVDKFGDVAKNYSVKSMPTVKIYQNGKQRDQFTGLKYPTAAAFKTFLQGLLAA